MTAKGWHQGPSTTLLILRHLHSSTHPSCHSLCLAYTPNPPIHGVRTAWSDRRRPSPTGVCRRGNDQGRLGRVRLGEPKEALPPGRHRRPMRTTTAPVRPRGLGGCRWDEGTAWMRKRRGSHNNNNISSSSRTTALPRVPGSGPIERRRVVMMPTLLPDLAAFGILWKRPIPTRPNRPQSR